MENSFINGGMILRPRMGGNHYITCGMNYALSSHKFEGLLDETKMFGCCIGYGMDTVFGPLEATINYTNHSEKVGLYINLGCKF